MYDYMSQKLDYIKKYSSKPVESQKKTLIIDAAQSEISASVMAILTFSVAKIFESISTSLDAPVASFDGETISLNTHLIENDKPYAIRYKNKDYVIIKSGSKTKLFELRE